MNRLLGRIHLMDRVWVLFLLFINDMILVFGSNKQLYIDDLEVYRDLFMVIIIFRRVCFGFFNSVT